MTACVIGLSSDEMEMQDLAEQEQAECQQRVAELLEQVINYRFHLKKIFLSSIDNWEIQNVSAFGVMKVNIMMFWKRKKMTV